MISIVARLALVFALAAAVAAQDAAAEDYPSHPIRLVGPYPAGGANDILARLVGQQLNARLGVPVLVENRSGASTMLGSEVVARAPADGYTLLLNNSTLGTTTVLYKKVPYKLDDFTAVAPLVSTGIVLTVSPALPAKSVAELIAYAKANPGKLNYASSGRGGATHLISEHFKRVAGIDAVGVEYRGAAPALTDLLAGHVQFYFYPVTGSLEHLHGGQLRALAVTGETRLAAAPEIPTFKELGYPAMTATIVYGIFGPAGLPPAVTARLNKTINEIIASDEVKTRLIAEGDVPLSGTPPEFLAAYKQNLAFWSATIRALDLHLD